MNMLFKCCVLMVLVGCVAGQDVSGPVECANSIGCDCNVVFLLDISGSVAKLQDAEGKMDLESLKTFTNALIDLYYNISGKINVGIITFENDAKVLAELGTTQNTLKWRVNGIQPSLGYTNYMDAFEKQKKMLEDWEHTDTYIDSVILITDGEPTKMGNITVESTDFSFAGNVTRQAMNEYIKSMVEAQTSRDKNRGFRVITVRMSKTSKEATLFLQSLTKGNGGLSFKDGDTCPNPPCLAANLYYEDYNKLNDITNDRVKEQIAMATCGNQIPDPLGDCTEIVVLTDMSGSMGSQGHDNIRAVLVELFKSTQMSGRQAALVSFNNNNVVTISEMSTRSSNQHFTTLDNEIKTSFKKHAGGWTGMAAGFKYIHDNVFTTSPTKKLLLLLTDGQPTMMIGGGQYEEWRKLDERRAMITEVEQQRDALVTKQVTLTSVCVTGKMGASKDFLKRLCKEESGQTKVKALSSYTPDNSKTKVAEEAQDLIRNFCPRT